jgi:hypothetical protein
MPDAKIVTKDPRFVISSDQEFETWYVLERISVQMPRWYGVTASHLLD